MEEMPYGKDQSAGTITRFTKPTFLLMYPMKLKPLYWKT
jgi:hypothetical protein